MGDVVTFIPRRITPARHIPPILYQKSFAVSVLLEKEGRILLCEPAWAVQGGYYGTYLFPQREITGYAFNYAEAVKQVLVELSLTQRRFEHIELLTEGYQQEVAMGKSLHQHARVLYLYVRMRVSTPVLKSAVYSKHTYAESWNDFEDITQEYASHFTEGYYAARRALYRACKRRCINWRAPRWVSQYLEDEKVIERTRHAPRPL